ncbi:hypothetical protein ACJJIP_04645 [Microbulbifer sp. VTAC004]|uniref:hypothetical protein n=1 Tax=Microbulbifer TaxID=48073 RepID=UPI0012FCDB60|nr:hypothetical protein [Microbulbifer variabilis]
MNWIRILKFSILLFISLTTLSTCISYFWGISALEYGKSKEFFLLSYGASSLLSIVILSILAKKQEDFTFLHCTITCVICWLFSTATLAILLETIYYPKTWIIDAPITIVEISIATLIGVMIRRVNSLRLTQGANT